MTSDPGASRERFEELFIADLLFGLTDHERAEFDSLAASHGQDELNSLADLIALFDVAKASSDNSRLPPRVRERIRSQATAELSQATSVTPASRPSLQKPSRLPWAVSIVSLLIAVVVVATTWPFGRRADISQDPAEMRERLIASARDLIREDWSAGPTPVDGAKGDVTWSGAEQRGYLRFEGLPINDPSVEQYQLWIFDKNQSEATPVDGGVFDIASTGEVVVPIRPALSVREPYLFAVTIEKPGGVVVSDRSRLPLIAAVGETP